MPQIEFQPPLATTTSVHLPPRGVFGSATDPRVTLSFIARPVDGLAEDDVVEIWTDGGTSGSWRAVRFERKCEAETMVARISVDMAEGSFGFTYRLTHASGDVTWLGDMGGNGKIELMSPEGGDALWKGEDWLKLDNEWTGFGVQVDDSGLASGVEIGQKANLSFAYLHPCPSTVPFATFHPTIPDSTYGSAFGLLATMGSTLDSTAASLTTTSQSTETMSSTGRPAAYASYCGLGFSGGEQERTKAFRSLLGLAHHGLQYVPCTGTSQGKKVHAVGLLASIGGSGKPNRLITYLAGGSNGEWDLSGIVSKENGVALWDSEFRHAQVAGTTLRMTSDSSAVHTLQIVDLFDLSDDGSILLGIIDDTNSQWTFSAKRTETERIPIDEVVSSPMQQGKALGETSDSGETIESSGVPSFMDFTLDADNETLGTSVDDVDEETMGKVAKEGVEVSDAPSAEVTEGGTEAAPSEPEQLPTNIPTAPPAPKKSILRFFWITLSFLNSLWWGTLSWFRQWFNRKPAAMITEEDSPEEAEQAPLIQEVEPANYASTNMQPDVAKPDETIEDSAETPVQNSTGSTAESEIETIRVSETRTIVFPAQITAVVSRDVLLLTNTPLARLAGEIKNAKADEWRSLGFVQEDVAPTSEMKMMRLPVSTGAEVRIRLA